MVFRWARWAAASTSIGLFLLPPLGSAGADLEDALPFDPQRVLSRAFANLYGYSSIQHVEIRSRHGDGQEFLRTAHVVRRGAQAGLNRMLVRLLGPGELRGMGLLLLERPDFSYDAFLYQPAIQRVRRISVAQRRDAFFGTDVYFEDLEAKRPAQWRARLLREEDLDGRAAHVLEVVPKDIPSGYERIVAWFDHELPLMLRAEFYRGGRRDKVMEIDLERVRELGDHFVPEIVIFRSSRGTVTTIEISEIDLRRELPDHLFTRKTLEISEAAFEAGIR